MPRPAEVPPEPPAGPPPRTPRERIVLRLAEQVRRFPNFDLAGPDCSGLDERDAAFTHAVHDAAMRHWLTLEYLIASRLDRPVASVEPRLRAVLLAGAAQILYLDRVPAHAAIDESVEIAKRFIRHGAGGLANAVLRRIADLRTAERRERYEGRRDELPLADGAALRLAEDVFPDDGLLRWAAATGHAPWLARRWSRRIAGSIPREHFLHSLVHPPIILNAAHAARPLDAFGLRLSPHRRPGHFVLRGNHADIAAFLASRPDVWVQDPASAEAVNSLPDFAPRLIVDACAGQGTKSRQLAARFPDAQLVVSDADPTRLAILLALFADSRRVRVLPPRELLLETHGKADLVLLDVPCTNSGVLARRVEAKARADDRQLQRLTETQRQIVADSIPLLSERGTILYSTCSLEPEENNGVVQWAAKWHRFKVESERSTEPSGLPGGPPEEYHDGSYSALLRWK